MALKTIKHKQTIKLGSTPGWGTEYWTEEDWERHREYVEQLKKSGDYMKEVESTIEIVPCPLFDEPRAGADISEEEGIAVAMLIPTTNL